ncbi:hypothetical protein LTR28_011250 [Elasticomyces elasticus]|nr:hypothetical protein LTR28_011250 [Elasticomyces elasticus]
MLFIRLQYLGMILLNTHLRSDIRLCMRLLKLLIILQTQSVPQIEGHSRPWIIHKLLHDHTRVKLRDRINIDRDPMQPSQVPQTSGSTMQTALLRQLLRSIPTEEGTRPPLISSTSPKDLRIIVVMHCTRLLPATLRMRDANSMLLRVHQHQSLFIPLPRARACKHRRCRHPMLLKATLLNPCLIRRLVILRTTISARNRGQSKQGNNNVRVRPLICRHMFHLPHTIKADEHIHQPLTHSTHKLKDKPTRRQDSHLPHQNNAFKHRSTVRSRINISLPTRQHKHHMPPTNNGLHPRDLLNEVDHLGMLTPQNMRPKLRIQNSSRLHMTHHMHCTQFNRTAPKGQQRQLPKRILVEARHLHHCQED